MFCGPTSFCSCCIIATISLFLLFMHQHPHVKESVSFTRPDQVSLTRKVPVQIL